MVRAKGAAPAREFSRGSRAPRLGPSEAQAVVSTNWTRVGRSRVRGGVDVARVNWQGLIAQPADMRLRIRRPYRGN